MNFKQVLIIALVVLYIIYTNIFYMKLLVFPIKFKKIENNTPDKKEKVSSMMKKNKEGEEYTENENEYFSEENYIADWGENSMKDKQQIKECIDLKEDKDSSITKWIERQEYLAKGVCNDSKFCPCKRNEIIV
jgi:hypothetical protein